MQWHGSFIKIEKKEKQKNRLKKFVDKQITTISPVDVNMLKEFKKKQKEIIILKTCGFV